MPRKTLPPDTSTAFADEIEQQLAKLSFEDAVSELESIVSRMEDGELSLQESLLAYQRGAALVGRCRTALDAVNEQVRVLEGNLLKPVVAREVGSLGEDV